MSEHNGIYRVPRSTLRPTAVTPESAHAALRVVPPGLRHALALCATGRASRALPGHLKRLWRLGLLERRYSSSARPGTTYVMPPAVWSVWWEEQGVSLPRTGT